MKPDERKKFLRDKGGSLDIETKLNACRKLLRGTVLGAKEKLVRGTRGGSLDIEAKCSEVGQRCKRQEVVEGGGPMCRGETWTYDKPNGCRKLKGTWGTEKVRY